VPRSDGGTLVTEREEGVAHEDEGLAIFRPPLVHLDVTLQFLESGLRTTRPQELTTQIMAVAVVVRMAEAIQSKPPKIARAVRVMVLPVFELDDVRTQIFLKHMRV